MERVMDGVMDAEGGEKMRVQIFFREKGSLFRQCWISGLATAHCSACFHTKHSALAPNQLKPTNVSEPPQTTRFLFASDAFAQPLFSLFIFLTPIHCLLPLASSFKFSLPSLCFSFAVSPFLQPSGDTPGCGIGPGPPGFHSDTLCPDVISIDGGAARPSCPGTGVVYCLPQT